MPKTLKSFFKIFLLDLLLIVIYLILPVLMQITGLPIYFYDPARVLVILLVAHTNPVNALVMAIILPLTGMAVTIHPVFLKSFIMIAEMVINVLLLIYFLKIIRNSFFSALLSIVISKCIYYLMKYVSIRLGWLDMELFSTPLLTQGIIAVVLSLYFFLIIRYRQSKKTV